MPREIDCPDCGGKYRKVRKTTDLDTDILYGTKVIEYCKSCKGGKITVYTEEEVQELIKQEREECALICENHEGVIVSAYYTQALDDCAEAIRALEE